MCPESSKQALGCFTFDIFNDSSFSYFRYLLMQCHDHKLPPWHNSRAIKVVIVLQFFSREIFSGEKPVIISWVRKEKECDDTWMMSWLMLPSCLQAPSKMYIIYCFVLIYSPILTRRERNWKYWINIWSLVNFPVRIFPIRAISAWRVWFVSISALVLWVF